MEIQIADRQKDLPLDSDVIKKVITEVISFEKVRCDEVSVHFVNVEEISRLHLHYFKDDSPTDCISFPIDGEESDYRVLGEVFVCPSIAIEYVDEHGGNVIEETILYLVHGLLHLIGYDDIDDNDRKKMKASEQRNMDHLKALKVFD